MIVPITQRLPELRKAKGWSRGRLSREAYAIDPVGTSSDQIASIELGRRPPSARTMVTLAEVLEVDPTEFVEFRLALARHILDEERVGLNEAIAFLEASKLEPIDVPVEEIAAHARRRRPAGTPAARGQLD